MLTAIAQQLRRLINLNHSRIQVPFTRARQCAHNCMITQLITDEEKAAAVALTLGLTL
jgi:hypothetical protein